jgi:signal transduction histidine kinase
MTTDTAPETLAGGGLVRIGLRHFNRLFNGIVGGFGLLYALQTTDSLAADLRSMSNPLGFVVIGLVVLSVLVGLVPVLVQHRAGSLFLAGTVLYCAALLIWPFAVRPPVPTDPMPWLIAVWPVCAAYGAQASRTRVVPAIGAVLVSALAGFELVSVGIDAADAVVNSLFMLGIALVLVLLLGTVRNNVVIAAQAQQAALAGFAATRTDDATEEERKRTDALMHDSVLTTFLAAAAARTPDDEDLARRMAANSLRVLLHVNGLGREGTPVLPFGQALAARHEELAALLPVFDADFHGAESVVLPEDVAGTVIELVLETMRNSVQHAAGATRRSIRAEPLGPDGIRVTVQDDGCGFDPTGLRRTGAGNGRRAVHRLRALDGRADVRTAPGRGVQVVLSWGSIVVSGTSLLSDDELAVTS